MTGNGDGVPGIVLRRADSSDVDLLARIHAESWVATYRGALPDAYLDGQVQAERALHWTNQKEEIDRGTRHVVIAERDGVTAGFICMVMPDEELSVYIDNLHALPGFKGQGLGGAMLDHAKEWAIANGATSMNLLVLDSNASAIRFYESRGWLLVGTEDDVMGGVPIVALRYRLALDT